MGDIGTERREVEFEPLPPVPVRDPAAPPARPAAPAEPGRQPQPTPAPTRD